MAKAKRGILSEKFTGTRGLIDALDDPTLFKKRYIGNIQANIESFEDKGADPSTLTLFQSTTTFTGELAAAKKLSAADWAAFVQDFRTSPVTRLPFVADWVRARRGRQRQKVTLSLDAASEALIGAGVRFGLNETSIRKGASALARLDNKTVPEAFHVAEATQFLSPEFKVTKARQERFDAFNRAIASTTSSLLSIHEARSPLAKSSDERQEHSLVIEPDDPRVAQWKRDPGRMDVRGIDTPKKSKGKKRSPRKSRQAKGGGTNLRSMRK